MAELSAWRKITTGQSEEGGNPAVPVIEISIRNRSSSLVIDKIKDEASDFIALQEKASHTPHTWTCRLSVARVLLSQAGPKIIKNKINILVLFQVSIRMIRHNLIN